MLTPRDGVSPTWNEYIRDKISAEKLTRVVAEKNPPTLSDIQTALAGSIEYGNARHHHAVIKKLWWEEATRLYKIVRPTLNLTGLFQEIDLRKKRSNVSGLSSLRSIRKLEAYFTTNLSKKGGFEGVMKPMKPWGLEVARRLLLNTKQTFTAQGLTFTIVCLNPYCLFCFV